MTTKPDREQKPAASFEDLYDGPIGALDREGSDVTPDRPARPRRTDVGTWPGDAGVTRRPAFTSRLSGGTLAWMLL